jgi:hypothetical protein
LRNDFPGKVNKFSTNEYKDILFSVLSRTEKGHGIFFLKRAPCTYNLPKRHIEKIG